MQFIENLLVGVENPKESKKKLSEVKREFTKVSACKSIYFKMYFLYTIKELPKAKIERI